jgi:hypothetical protein
METEKMGTEYYTFGQYDYTEEYKKRLELVISRARMGEDKGIHLVVSPEQDPLIQEGVKL